MKQLLKNGDLEIKLPDDWILEQGVKDGDTLILTPRISDVLIQTEEQYNNSLEQIAV
jgi:hypothetical protein